MAGAAAAARLVADGAGLDAVLAVDRFAWFLSGSVVVPAAVSALLAALGMWRHGGFPLAVPVAGVVLGLVMLASGLLGGSPATYPLGSALSLSVAAWWLWVLWTGILLVRRRVSPQPERVLRAG